MKLLIKVPATSANLGPGFDTLGLALDLWNETTVTPADEFILQVQGEAFAYVVEKDHGAAHVCRIDATRSWL